MSWRWWVLIFQWGRLDESAHPFCGGVPDDIRITARYDETDPAKGLMAIIHETGHALYEAGLPSAWRLQPVGRSRGSGIHESQSLLIEMQAGRSRAFVSALAPLMVQAFGPRPGLDAANLAQLALRVSRGLIRVDADEVTYPLHIILRYRLEKALLAGDLMPAGLPDAWAQGMKNLLGVAPPDDRDGCMQDIHWYWGHYGYFPCYSLGALAAAQMFDTACHAYPEIPERLAQGDFAPLVAWARTEIHERASLLSPDALIETATGASLSTAAFKAHLARRYLGHEGSGKKSAYP